MKSIKLSAPAKVNLFLRVLNKRKDSYHNLLTLFERISLADIITLTKRHSGIVIISDKFITHNPKDNLVYKAAELILGKGKITSGVKIHIKKNIPIAAGLGGGSSDAASVLIGINILFNLKLNKEELVNLAKKLGADVPFFVLEAPLAIGTAKGDELKRIGAKVSFWHLIINPGFGLGTREVYASFDRKHKQAGGLTKDFGDAKIRQTLEHAVDSGETESMLYNDLEDIAVNIKPAIGKILERLASSLNKKAILSGSGPSVFCLYSTRKEAVEGRKKLLKIITPSERKVWQVFIAETE